MKQVILLLCCIYSMNTIAQVQFNDFENFSNLEIEIDSTSMDSIWQIGAPQKTLFESSYSPPNALLTDTINNYPTNLSASFIVELSQGSMWGFPYIQIDWFQKLDLENGIDGGIIEASYDSGASWLNVFSDTTFRPAVVGEYEIDTLFNGEIGLTGTSSDWSWVALCWGTYYGTKPTTVDPIQIRFTIKSDSIDSNQEGWMLDNFTTQVEIVGSTSNENEIKPIPLYPNPSHDEIRLDLNEIEFDEGLLRIVNKAGQLMYTEKILGQMTTACSIEIKDYPQGIYFLVLETDGQTYQQRFVKVE